MNSVAIITNSPSLVYLPPCYNLNLMPHLKPKSREVWYKIKSLFQMATDLLLPFMLN